MRRVFGLIIFYFGLIQHYIGMIAFYVLLVQNYTIPIKNSAERYFSTRELALLVLIIFAIGFLSIIHKDNKHILYMLKDILSARNSIVWKIIIVYFGCIIAFFCLGYIHHLWAMNLIGTLFLWLYSGVRILFSIFDAKTKYPFKKVIKIHLGWPVVWMFLAGIYTLPLWIEIVLSLMLLTLVTFRYVAHKELEESSGSLLLIKYSSHLIFVIFYLRLIFSLTTLTTSIAANEHDYALMVGKFMLPTIMTLFALVFTFALWVCIQYKNLFSRICIKNGQQHLHFHFKLAIISICRLNMKKISTFRSMNIGSRRFNQGQNFIDARTILTAKREKRQSLPEEEDGSNPEQGIFPLKEDGQPRYSAVTLEYPQGKAFVEGFRAIFLHSPEEMYRKNSRFILRVAQVVSSDLQVAREPLSIVNSVKLRIEHDLKKYVHDSIAIVSEADATKVYNLAIDTVCPEFTDRKL